MKNIFIVYPGNFSSYEKLKRKVINITKNIGPFSVTSIHDEREMLSRLSSDMNLNLKISPNLNVEEISHAIILNDGEKYNSYAAIMKDKNIPTRLITLKLAKAINIKGTELGKKNTDTYEYIGRGSKWGNPYSMYENGDDRDEVIRKFKYDFDFDKFLNVKKEDFLHLKGKTLGCFCKPQACHGDVIADYLNSLDDGE
ncbi:DUF4326 domain-containing protein [Pectobacterium versatile]|uniref:DUF4326 domain-containing protein n=1 Tax=Pectobacterium versatile TaxID=2488639 RepID=UPI000CFECE65|nr:DUF4326 domain-containing protein [Pectobacterium versatile]PRI17398.1 hypothetical protein BZY99_22280 [Pectobacterium versatile]